MEIYSIVIYLMCFLFNYLNHGLHMHFIILEEYRHSGEDM